MFRNNPKFQNLSLGRCDRYILFVTKPKVFLPREEVFTRAGNRERERERRRRKRERERKGPQNPFDPNIRRVRAKTRSSFSFFSVEEELNFPETKEATNLPPFVAVYGTFSPSFHRGGSRSLSIALGILRSAAGLHRGRG